MNALKYLAYRACWLALLWFAFIEGIAGARNIVFGAIGFGLFTALCAGRPTATAC